MPDYDPTDTASDDSAKYRFFSTVRRGYRPSTPFSGVDPPQDGDKPSLQTGGDVPVDVTVEASEGPGATETVTKTLDMYGPGHVTGIDSSQIVRMEPPPGTGNFPPNYFPLVEFDTPDLPFLFSPVDSDDDGRTYPWFTLAVVEQSHGSVSVDTSSPCPVLTVESPTDQLPPIEECWAWAHAQVVGSPHKKRHGSDTSSDGDPLEAEFKRESNLTVSRLIGARNLDPGTDYIAAVVPTFEAGRRAGLGEDPSKPSGGDQRATLAWKTDSGAELTLPVYHHWEFTTAKKGDFEYLVRKLESRRLSDPKYDIGGRPVDVTDPGPESLDYDDGNRHTVTLGGALQASPPGDWWYDRGHELRELLNRPARIESETGWRVVGPPIYGTWHANLDSLLDLRHPSGTYGGYGREKPALREQGEQDLQWIHDLNLTPSFRLAAAVGVDIVQGQQEKLMTAAWDQVGEIREANRLLGAAQLSRASLATTYDRLENPNYSRDRFLQYTAPSHDRLYLDRPGTTASAYVEDSALPSAVLSPAFRRLTSRAGRLARRLDDPSVLDSMVTAFLDEWVSTDHDRGPDGMFRIDFGGRRFGDLCPAIRQLTPPREDRPRPEDREEFEVDDSDWVDDPGSETGDDAMYLERLFCATGYDDPDAELPDPDAIETAYGPVSSFEDRIIERLGEPALGDRPDPLDTVMAYPEFTTPMYRDLKDESEEYLLPGVDNVPKETVGALVTNPAFIEAFMTGLNHEMGSELLWRRYPTDRSGSYFKRFWNQQSRLPKPTEPEEMDDILPIHRWEDKGPNGTAPSPLGSNTQTGETRQYKTDQHPSEVPTQVVLLIRGELLDRYPNTDIYAAAAKTESGDRVPTWASSETRQTETEDGTSKQKFPVFRGELDPDITFFGFDLDPAEARTGGPNDQGWFFVLAEPPTETRFGLDIGQEDEPSPPYGISEGDGPPTNRATEQAVDAGVEPGWSGLSWTHLGEEASPYLSVENTTPGEENATWQTIQGEPWAKSAAWTEAAGEDSDRPESAFRFDHEAAAEWGLNSGHMAYITWQKPVRVAIHADDILARARSRSGGDG